MYPNSVYELTERLQAVNRDFYHSPTIKEYGTDAYDAIHDTWDKLTQNQLELFQTKLHEGKIDGNNYVNNGCGCLKAWATFAAVGLESIDEIDCETINHIMQQHNIVVDSTAAEEQVLIPIRPGHTPENNPIARIIDEWLTVYLSKRFGSNDNLS